MNGVPQPQTDMHLDKYRKHLIRGVSSLKSIKEPDGKIRELKSVQSHLIQELTRIINRVNSHQPVSSSAVIRLHNQDVAQIQEVLSEEMTLLNQQYQLNVTIILSMSDRVENQKIGYETAIEMLHEQDAKLVKNKELIYEQYGTLLADRIKNHQRVLSSLKTKNYDGVAEVLEKLLPN